MIIKILINFINFVIIIKKLQYGWNMLLQYFVLIYIFINIIIFF